MEAIHPMPIAVDADSVKYQYCGDCPAFAFCYKRKKEKQVIPVPNISGETKVELKNMVNLIASFRKLLQES